MMVISIPPTLSYEIRCESHTLSTSSMSESQYSHTIYYDWYNSWTVISPPIIQPRISSVEIRRIASQFAVRNSCTKCTELRFTHGPPSAIPLRYL